MTLVYGENATFTVDLNDIARDNNTGDTQRYAIETTLPGTKYTFSMYDRSYNYIPILPNLSLAVPDNVSVFRYTMIHMSLLKTIPVC